MIDINIIRNTPEALDANLAKRGMAPVAAGLHELDKSRRAVQAQQQELQAKRNELSRQVGEIKKSGGNADAIMAQVATLKDDLDALTAQESKLAAELEEKLASLPNLVDEDVVAGDKEGNVAVREWGKVPSFDFTPKDHVELCTSLGLIDYERGTKLGGFGFWVYTGIGAQLEWALLNFFISEHLKDGYTFTLPPHILNYECGYAAGQFPKFEEDVFVLKDDERFRFMLPTSETALVNLYRDEILSEADLPKKLFAYTPCYRAEPGSHRASERGTIRGHQFNKIEMFHFATPEQSDASFDELVNKAEVLVQKLGLHHKVMKLAAGDVSAGMARTFDIEVYIPSFGYKEVSSCSNGRDYQARRGNIRCKGADGKNRFVHTLNASGLATSRLIPAITEVYQQADGSVAIPEVLQPFMGGQKVIQKP